MKQKLCGVFLALAMVLSLFPVAAMADTGSTVELTQELLNTCYDEVHKTYNLTESANYVLSGDLSVDKPIYICNTDKDINITIDLNGNILEGTSDSFLNVNYHWVNWNPGKDANLNHRTSLIVKDSNPSKTHTGEFSALTGGILASGGKTVEVTSNGLFTLQKGTITAAQKSKSDNGVTVCHAGEFVMNGGIITGCKNNGVGLYGQNGTPKFTMNDGKITANGCDGVNANLAANIVIKNGKICDNASAGVNLRNYDTITFDMQGGSITGNKGSGVFVENGIFTVSNDVNITNNTYKNKKGNVILWDGGVKEQRTITLGDLSSGAKIGVTLYNPPTGEERIPFTNESNTDYSDRITSDSIEYQVYYNNDTQKLELGTKPHNWAIDKTLSDDTNHVYKCTDDGCDKTKTEAHSSTGANVATCQKKAVCDVCGLTYGAYSKTNHGCTDYTYETESRWGYHQKVYTCSIGGYGEWEACSGGNATCITEGICDVCQHAYRNQTKHEGVVSTEWSHDDTSHWYAWSCCGARVDVTEHTSTTAPTCKTKAVCEVCNAEYGDVSGNNHEGELDTTTWVTDGTSHWHEWSCCGAKADVTAHSSTEDNVATCVAKAVCDVCEAEYGNTNPENHTGTVDETVWKSDADGHWHEYTCCGAQADAADHVYDNSSDKDCNICGYVRNISNGGSSGGGSSARKHTVSAKAATNGTVEISNTSVRKGTTVTLKVTPDAGYTLDKLRVLDSTGAEVAVEKLSDGRYSFQMPNSGVSIDASFKAEGETPDTTPSEDTTAQKKTMVLTIGQKEILVDGQKVVNDVAPMIKADRAVLPIRVVAEELGADVAWKEAEKKITITKGDKVIELVIGKADAAVNGAAVQLDAPAFIENDRAYLPLRFVANQLGADVAWSHAAQQVTITYQK